MRKLIVVHGGKPPSLKHAHNYVILLRGTGLSSMCKVVNMFTHSLDNAPSSVMHYVVCELIMAEKASIQIICVSLEAITTALRKH